MTLLEHSKIGRKNVILLQCDNCEKQFYAKKGTRDLDRELHFCSAKCSRQSLSNGKLKSKIQTNNIKKYGFVSPAQSAEVKSKIESTNIDRYGVKNPLMNIDVQNKSKQTNLERYGFECSLQNQEIKNKRDKTWDEKYGGTPLECNAVKEKIKQTNIEKYGANFFTSTNIFKEKVAKTNVERYGVTQIFSVPEVREKIKQTNLEKYGREIYAGGDDWESKLDREEIARKAWLTKIENGTCSKSSVEEKLNIILINRFTKSNVKRQVQIIKQWIDFYVVSLDLYIQVDGVYWHGLNRNLEVIKLGKTSQDKKIYKQVLRDEKLNQYMKENNMKLVRLTDEQINSLSEEHILQLLEI